MNDKSVEPALVILNQWLEEKARISEKQHLFRDAIYFWNRLLKRMTRQSSEGNIDVSQLAAIHYRLGLAHRALDDNRKSIYHLKYSVRLNSSEPRYYEAFGRAFLSGGHWRVAKAQFEKAIKLDPQNVTYLRQYAWVLLMMGKKNEALTFARRAYQIQSNKDSLMSLVRVYMELDMFLQALQLLKKAGKTQRVMRLVEECQSKLEATAEGAVLRCLRKGMLCDAKPFSLWDLRLAEKLWIEFCMTKTDARFEQSMPNIWAAALAWVVLYVRTAGESVELDLLANRFGATSVEIWPRIKNIQESLSLSIRAPQAA
ncbi:MAG: Tetratricopeptide repeat [Bacteriovoracaceae bacterium]|nr:Tetratricopeptide repeat [Bacteriovoracaceae bacterium]